MNPSWPSLSISGNGGALSNLRVLDLTRILSGPFATMILGDLGADVIKVEDVAEGDDTRQWAPLWYGPESAYFLSVNRNKRSIGVNLKSTEGADLIRQLARHADVFVENFRPGTAARLGLAYEDLYPTNRQLVYASISGFGQTESLSGEFENDALDQATSGIMSVTGEAEEEPVLVGVQLADVTAGMWAAIGILAALRAREKTLLGQQVDVSLLNSRISLQDPQVQAEDMIVEVDHPTAGPIRLTATPIKLSSNSSTVRLPPPLHGQHTNDVLTAIGIQPPQIDHLRKTDIVK